jgi:hypothetical protein
MTLPSASAIILPISDYIYNQKFEYGRAGDETPALLFVSSPFLQYIASTTRPKIFVGLMIITDKVHGRRDVIYESIYNIGDFICHVIVASHAENVDMIVSRNKTTNCYSLYRHTSSQDPLEFPGGGVHIRKIVQ